MLWVMDESVEGMGLRKFIRNNAQQGDAKVMLNAEVYVINTEQDILVRYVPTRIARILPRVEEFVEGTELYVNDVYTMVVMPSHDQRGFVLNTERK